MKTILGRMLVMLALALGAGAACAQYPSRAIKVIVPIPAGGAPDIAARVVGQKLSELLGTPVVVENHLGSNGNIAGGLDAVLSARPPAPFERADPRVRRPFADVREVELDYARRTGIFPIIHLVAMRREVYERDRWLPMNMFQAFAKAKSRSLERAAGMTASHYPLPWTADELFPPELLGAFRI